MGQAMITKKELTGIINLCWQAVAESEVGPVIGPNPTTKEPCVSSVAANTFYAALHRLIPTSCEMEGSVKMTEPPESWQGGQ